MAKSQLKNIEMVGLVLQTLKPPSTINQCYTQLKRYFLCYKLQILLKHIAIAM